MYVGVVKNLKIQAKSFQYLGSVIPRRKGIQFREFYKRLVCLVHNNLRVIWGKTDN
jgi:hypothetical protein